MTRVAFARHAGYEELLKWGRQRNVGHFQERNLSGRSARMYNSSDQSGFNSV